MKTLPLARQLASYLPETLVQRLLTEGLPEPGRPYPFQAATLFSDISGFTAMSEELAEDGPRGAEEVNRVLLLTFTGMIDIIHDLGGAVSHFYGDAMSIYFPDLDGNAASRALACAQRMQQLMQSRFNRVVTNRPPEKTPFFELTIKIGAGYGPCQGLIVGSEEIGMEFVLAGMAVDEAAAAEKHAQSGQVIASWDLLQRAGFHAVKDFSLVSEVVPPPLAKKILDWTAVTSSTLSSVFQTIAAFVPRAVSDRLAVASSESLAEHRPVTSLFVQFEFAGNASDTSDIDTAVRGRHLQEYYTWACDIIDRFGGENARLNRVLTGDKGNQLHIIFGAPVAPDAPAQALLCGLALQREKPEFVTSQKIGVAAGKVFAGPVGAADRREYTVVGDVVNLSARLMQVCAPGQVWTDGDTVRRVGDAIHFEKLPPKKLKGIKTAIPLFSAIEEKIYDRELQSFLGGWKTPLVGRKIELKRIRARLDRALSGVGQLLLITGATGVGKTRLAAAGVEHWLAAGGSGTLGKGQQHLAETPFGLWLNIWRGFFGLEQTQPLAAQMTAVAERTRALLPECEEDVWLWGEVLGLPLPAHSQLVDMTAEVRQARFFALVIDCFIAAASERPQLLLLEDVHWADQASLALLREFSRYLASHAICLIMTYRPQLADRLDKGLLIETNPIEIVDLTPAEAHQLLEVLVGKDHLPPAVEQQLGMMDRNGRESPVNPLFLEESINVMIEMGVLRLKNRVEIDELLLSRMQVPDTIHGLLLARLDRLPPAGREVLQVASVVGREFSRESVANITPEAIQVRLGELLASLTQTEMTRLLAADPEWVYLFHHAMTHEVAYESLPFARRQELHAAIANWLVVRFADNLKPLYATLAYHYGRADAHVEGLEYALAAAHAARDLFANAEAFELYSQAEKHLWALGMVGNWETAVQIYLARGDVARYLGDFSASLADGEKALALAEKHHSLIILAQAYNLLADIKFRLPRYEDVQELTGKVIGLGNQVRPDDLARAYQWSGMAASALGDYEMALTHLQQAESICLDNHNNRRLALVLEAIAYLHFTRQDLEAALAALQRSVDLSRNFSIPANVASNLNNIALVQAQLGRAEDALKSYEEALPLVEKISRGFYATILSNKAETEAYLGLYRPARENLEKVIELFTEMKDPNGLIEAYLRFGYDYYSALGNWEAARKSLSLARQLMGDNPGDYYELEARLFIAEGQLALQARERDRALQLFQASKQIIEEKKINWWLPAVLYYIGVVFGEDTAVRAQTYFDRAEEVIEKGGGCPDFRPLILLARARLVEADSERSQYLQACVQAVETRARYTDKITCLQEAGQLLQNEPDRALYSLGKRCLGKAKTLMEYSTRV